MLTSYFLAAVAALSSAAQARWIFYDYNGNMLSYGRLDPIIAPGEVSAHVHMFQGANAVQTTYDYDTIREESTCSTIIVQEDMSNYWTPAMYYWDGKDNFTLIRGDFHIYYLNDHKSYDPNSSNGIDNRTAFPEGLEMVAGNMYSRYTNWSDPTTYAAEFQCQRSDLDSPYSKDMRDFQKSGQNCDDSLRMTVDFPSCWDGVNVKSADHYSHVAYPTNGVCPETHPVAMIELLAEYYFHVEEFPFDPTRDDQWVFSFGDTSGYGAHADFTNGWNRTLLQEAIDSCTDETAPTINNCAPFAEWHNVQIPPCMPSGLYPNENVGLHDQSLTALPGCNPVWSDNSTKATCDEVETPPVDLQLGPDLSSWNYLGCPMSYDTVPILSALQQTNLVNMTVDSCLSSCKEKGFKYAGMVWGNQCWCDNIIENNATTASDPNYACWQRCATDELQYCGGWGSLQVYEACSGDGCHANVVYSTLTTAAPTWTDTATGAAPTASSTSSGTTASTTAESSSAAVTAATSSTISAAASSTTSTTAAAASSTTTVTSSAAAASSTVTEATSSTATATTMRTSKGHKKHSHTKRSHAKHSHTKSADVELFTASA